MHSSANQSRPLRLLDSISTRSPYTRIILLHQEHSSPEKPILYPREIHHIIIVLKQANAVPDRRCWKNKSSRCRMT